MTAPWWQVRPPLVPGGLRGAALEPPSHSARVQRGTTKKWRCPLPTTGTPRRTARRQLRLGTHVGEFWGPILPPCRSRAGQAGKSKQIDTDTPRVQFHCARVQPDATPGQPPIAHGSSCFGVSICFDLPGRRVVAPAPVPPAWPCSCSRILARAPVRRKRRARLKKPLVSKGATARAQD